MPWQDFVFTIGNVIFIFALIPSITGKDKPPVLTSLPSSIVLLTFSFAFATLGLWWSAFVTLIVSILWLILAIQKYKSSKKKR